MKKILLLSLLFIFCIASQNAFAELDYDRLKDALDKYGKAFSGYHSNLHSSWKENPNDAPEDKLRFELYDSAVSEARQVSYFMLKLHVYLRFKPLISKDKMPEFEDMLKDEMGIVIRALKSQASEYSLLKRLKEVTSIEVRDLTSIVLQVEDGIEELVTDLEALVQ